MYNALILWSILTGMVAQQKPAQATNQTEIRLKNGQTAYVAPPRNRALSPLRLGGVYLRGLGSEGNPQTESAKLGIKVSAANSDWIARYLDVAALSASTILPDTLGDIRKRQPLFTPLLYTYASSLYEQEGHSGNVGGWSPALRAETLRSSGGSEAVNPEPGAHWMDFASTIWAGHWADRVHMLTRRYGADGAVAAELPLANHFVPEPLARYHSNQQREEATVSWLSAAHRPGDFLLVASALGFEASAPHATTPPAPEREQTELSGRIWDDVDPDIDGAWSEGWIHPYWLKQPLPEKLWEIDMEAADRAAIADQVFIAGVSYRNDTELEYAIASYLLIAHRQGRFVLQPMPIRPGMPDDAGFSLSVAKAEVQRRPSYFDIPLGISYQSRHLVPAVGGWAWRRAFQRGLVYVNSNDRSSAEVLLGSRMQRLDGRLVSSVRLSPHSGAVLLYPTPALAKPGAHPGSHK